jgi:glutaredoxin 3
LIRLLVETMAANDFCSRIALPIFEILVMSRVTVYSTASCPICVRAKTMLDKWEIVFDEVMIDADAAAMKEFAEVTNGARTVPQIIIDGKPVGGFSELTELHMDGELDELMQQD